MRTWATEVMLRSVKFAEADRRWTEVRDSRLQMLTRRRVFHCHDHAARLPITANKVMGVRLGQRERANPLGMIAPIAAAVRARRSEKTQVDRIRSGE